MKDLVSFKNMIDRPKTDEGEEMDSGKWRMAHRELIPNK